VGFARGSATAFCLASLACACSLGLDGFSSSAATADGDAGAPDATADASADASEGDSGIDAPKTGCNLGAPFGAPASIASLNTPDNDELWPRLTPDELTMVLATARSPNAFGLYITKRASRDAPFDPPHYMTNVNQPGAFDADPMITANGLTFFFQSDRTGDQALYWSKRASLTDEFPAPAPLTGVNTTAREVQPFLTADGVELYFSRYIPPGATEVAQIHRAVALGTGFGTAEEVLELASPEENWLPTPSANRLTMYFSSKRTGGQGDHDIWVSRRASVTSPWSMPTVVTELNSPGLDASGWLSVDECRLYFHSRRDGATTSDLYVAEKPR